MRTQQDLLENHEHNMANDKKIQLLSECQDYHYKQSSNVSSLARYIIYAIIATIWLTINAESFLCINWWLRIALFAAFLYLLADIVHYFWDSVSYRREYFKFEKEIGNDIHLLNRTEITGVNSVERNVFGRSQRRAGRSHDDFR